MKKVLLLTSFVALGAVDANNAADPQIRGSSSGQLNQAEQLIQDVLTKGDSADPSFGTVKQKREIIAQKLGGGTQSEATQKSTETASVAPSVSEKKRLDAEVADTKSKVDRLSDAMLVTEGDKTLLPKNKDLAKKVKEQYESLSDEGKQEFRDKLKKNLGDLRSKLRAAQIRLKALA